MFDYELDDSFVLYRAISQGNATEMADNVHKYLKDGYRKFQLKVGGNASDDIARIRAVRELLDVKTKELRESSKMKIKNGLLKPGEYDESNLHIPLLCDANTGWLQHDAVRVRNTAKCHNFPFLKYVVVVDTYHCYSRFSGLI
jgi:cis-L-3-hydroxyproline dehydratase